WRNAARSEAASAGDRALKNPITGAPCCCALAANLVHHTDRCLLQPHVQSDIMFHRSSPSLQGHISMASFVPGELIPCAFVWHDLYGPAARCKRKVMIWR